MSMTLPPEFEKALEKKRHEYAEWYSNRAVEDAESNASRGNPYRINAPGEYEHGLLSDLGEAIWEDEYADKAGYFDEAALAFYISVQSHKALEKLDPGAYDYMSPADFAFEAVQMYDSGMDLPAIILTVWEDLGKG